ncbi:MAG: hypothetical protein E5X63_04720, partial [Mesorhizobium sp.]
MDELSFLVENGTCSSNRARCPDTLTNRRDAWRLLHVVVSAGLGLACMLSTSAVNAKEYVLGPQDKLRVKVYEWRASRDTIFAWAALNDEY